MTGLYGVALRLYPRSFREEYGEDMALLLAAQLRDEPALRVWSRALVDLALTVPHQHLEVRMSRSAPGPAALYAGLAVLSLATGVVLGGTVGLGGVGVVGVVAAVAFAALAVTAARRARGLEPSHGGRLVLLGALGLAGALGAATAAGELSEPQWALFAAAALVSLAVLATGAVQLATRRRTA